jgi:arginyl-tRNA synthetase
MSVDVGRQLRAVRTAFGLSQRELAKRAIQLEETLSAVANECKPNVLTAYLYDLAAAFSKSRPQP